MIGRERVRVAGEYRLQPWQDQGAGREAARLRIERLTNWLDRSFTVPGTKWRVGADGVLGLIPGIGDGLGLALSAYILWEARNLDLPPRLMGRMAFNAVLDAAIGSVPVLGDLADFVFQANERNLTLIHAHLRLRDRGMA